MESQRAKDADNLQLTFAKSRKNVNRLGDAESTMDALQSLFNQYDEDDSGFIEANEFAELIRSVTTSTVQTLLLQG